MYQALYSSNNGKIYSRGERRREKDEWRKTHEERKGGRASPILSLPFLAHATSRTFRKVMLHGTIRNGDFLRNTALQCWNSVTAI